MSSFCVVQQAANGGLLHDPVVGGARKKCTEPETVVGISSRRRRAPAAFRNFRQWNAQNVRQPDTVGKFIMGVQKA